MELRGPFFLVGFQRSGTTLLRLMLNAHPNIAIPHDSAELWLRYRGRLARYNDLRDSSDVRRLIEDLLREPRIAAWQTVLPTESLFADPMPSTFAEVMRRFYAVYAGAHGKSFWGDKNTGNLTELDQLNTMFPTCKIIHLVRDGRDCALSHLSKEYIYGYENVLRAAVEWKEQVTLCHKMGGMLSSERFYELCYEGLLANPERELSQLCAFLSVSFSPRMLNYHEEINKYVPEHKQSLWPLLNKPPLAANASKWKSQMKPGDRAVFERIAGPLLREFGYETMPAPVRGGRLRELWYDLHSRISWRFKKMPVSKNRVREGEAS
jgi:Sulfotransferase family